MKKDFLFVLAIISCSSCLASIDDLSKAIKKSDLQRVEALSQTLILTDAELTSFADMAREVVEQRQLYGMREHGVKKRFIKSGGIGWRVLFGGMLGVIGSFLCIVIFEDSLSDNDTIKIFLVTGASAIVAIGGLVAVGRAYGKAAKATSTYYKECYSNALDIRRLLICWPLVQRTAQL